MKTILILLNHLKTVLQWAAVILLGFVVLAIPAFSLVALAGGPAKDGSLGEMAYIFWPITLLSFVITFMVDIVIFRRGDAYARSCSLPKLLWRSSGPVTSIWLATLLLPIAMNLTSAVLGLVGFVGASRTMFEWRWNSQFIAIGLAILAPFAWQIFRGFSRWTSNSNLKMSGGPLGF